jgi:hypothetical protein
MQPAGFERWRRGGPSLATRAEYRMPGLKEIQQAKLEVLPEGMMAGAKPLLE